MGRDVLPAADPRYSLITRTMARTRVLAVFVAGLVVLATWPLGLFVPPSWVTTWRVVPALAAQGSRAQSGRPARDVPAQPARVDGTGRISGRVLTTDTGRPVRRARVLLNAPELPGGRGTLTDGEGGFDFTGLPAGRYILAASKSGFVTLAYGQRRPLQPGTPLQLQDAQQLTGIELRLPRGSVIAGRVYDETGDPLPGATVRVLAYRYAQGSRQLVPAGSAQSDDRGEYRVWGLNPGDYYVTALARNVGLGRGGRGLPPFAPNAGGPPPQLELADQAEPSGYAPTYYPGVESVVQAQPITVALGAEALDIDFGVLLVRTARVAGRVATPSGAAVSFGIVLLTPEGPQTGRSSPGASFTSRVQNDGAFSIPNVPPGRYLLRARGEESDVPYFATLPMTVAGADISGVSVVLAPGATITGTVRLQPSGASTADVTQFRIGAPSADPDSGMPGPQSNARVERDGRFSLAGLAAGPHWIRARAPGGWILKSVAADGRDVTDTPIELRSGQQLSGVSLVFTDRASEIHGVVSDEHDAPLTDYTLLVFPSEASLWNPQSRHIMTARPDQNGAFQMRGLPAGEYLLVAVDPTEAGEWFEPAYLEERRAGAVRILLGEGDIKTQNVKIAASK